MRGGGCSRALIAFGVGCLLFYGIVTIRTWQYQREGEGRVWIG